MVSSPQACSEQPTPQLTPRTPGRVQTGRPQRSFSEGSTTPSGAGQAGRTQRHTSGGLTNVASNNTFVSTGSSWVLGSLREARTPSATATTSKEEPVEVTRVIIDVDTDKKLAPPTGSQATSMQVSSSEMHTLRTQRSKDSSACSSSWGATPHRHSSKKRRTTSGSFRKMFVERVGEAVDVAMGVPLFPSRISPNGNSLVVGDLMKAGAQAGAAGVGVLAKTYHTLKQSVADVLRFDDIQVKLYDEMKVKIFIAEIEVIHGVRSSVPRCSKRFCDRMCGKRKYTSFGTFRVKLDVMLEPADKGGGLLLRGRDPYKCWVPRVFRRRGDVYLDFRLIGLKTQPFKTGGFRSIDNRRKKIVLAKCRMQLPTWSGKGQIRVSASTNVLRSDECSLDSNLSTPSKSTSSRMNALNSIGKGAALDVEVKLGLFETFEVFDINWCKPAVNLVVDEWTPDSEKAWNGVWDTGFQVDDDTDSNHAIRAMAEDMKKGTILLYQTLYAQNSRRAPCVPYLSQEQWEMHDRRVMFLKRLILTLAVCRLSYTNEENGSTHHTWPFPLAAALCHGSRILIRLDGVPWQQFVNFLVIGDPMGHDWKNILMPPKPMYSRTAATHAVGMESDSCHIFERKLTLINSYKNLQDGRGGHHLGMDIPIGGLGNPVPKMLSDRLMTTVHSRRTLMVGPAGVPMFKPASVSSSGRRGGGWENTADEPAQFFDEVQHGHVYLRWDDFGKHMVPVLRPRQVGATSTGNGGKTSTHSEFLEGQTRWLGLPTCHSIEDLNEVLRQHGLKASIEQSMLLYKLIVGENQLTLEADHRGNLRLRGVLIQLMMEKQDRHGNTWVLVQTSCRAQQRLDRSLSWQVELRSDTSCEDIVELQVPTTIRFRHESWNDAVARCFEKQWGMHASTTGAFIERCRKQEGEMCVYACPAVKSVCHHHETAVERYDGNLGLAYQAYRFVARFRESDTDEFQGLLQDSFSTLEEDVQLHGLGNFAPDTIGSKQRFWKWIPHAEAVAGDIPGVVPPEDRLQVIYESDNISSVLIGVEASAPHKENFFGGKHNISGIANEISAFGARKWKDFRRGLQEVPADIGGIHLSVDPDNFETLQGICQQMELTAPSKGRPTTESEKALLAAEKKLFRKLLEASDTQASAILSNVWDIPMPLLHRHTGTMVLDGIVRERAISTPGVSFQETGSFKSGSSYSSGAARRDGMLRAEMLSASRAIKNLLASTPLGSHSSLSLGSESPSRTIAEFSPANVDSSDGILSDESPEHTGGNQAEQEAVCVVTATSTNANSVSMVESALNLDSDLTSTPWMSEVSKKSLMKSRSPGSLILRGAASLSPEEPESTLEAGELTEEGVSEALFPLRSSSPQLGLSKPTLEPVLEGDAVTHEPSPEPLQTLPQSLPSMRPSAPTLCCASETDRSSGSDAQSSAGAAVTCSGNCVTSAGCITMDGSGVVQFRL